jgi:hypothetical protein
MTLTARTQALPGWCTPMWRCLRGPPGPAWPGSWAPLGSWPGWWLPLAPRRTALCCWHMLAEDTSSLQACTAGIRPLQCAGKRQQGAPSATSAESREGQHDIYLLEDAGTAIGCQQVLQQCGLAHATLADHQDFDVLLAGPRRDLRVCNKHVLCPQRKAL